MRIVKTKTKMPVWKDDSEQVVRQAVLPEVRIFPFDSPTCQEYIRVRNDPVSGWVIQLDEIKSLQFTDSSALRIVAGLEYAIMIRHNMEHGHPIRPIIKIAKHHTF